MLLSCMAFTPWYNPHDMITPMPMTRYNCISAGQSRRHAISCATITMVLSSSIINVVPACENPRLINMWCRCVLSGWNGEVPRIMRDDITRSVSATGITIAASVKGMSPEGLYTPPIMLMSEDKVLITKIDLFLI